MDRLAVVLLQCAYEMKQDDGSKEEEFFCRYYLHRGTMPFPIAIMWYVVLYNLTASICST